MKTPIIDSHQHFWDPASGGDFAWLSGPFEPINRKFDPADLEPSLVATGVSGTVLVQTWSDLGETYDFLKTAAETDFVKGVVGWLDLADRNVAEILSQVRTSEHGEWLVGVRYLVPKEEPGWLLREDAQRGLSAVQAAGLVYDFVPRVHQLSACVQTAIAFPHCRFVLDHIAKPDIRNGQFEEWSAIMRSFKPERSHVWCKLSGMVTEADWENWKPADLKPYVREVLEIFGSDRCLFGTDWPVCLVAGSYERVVDALRECLHDLSSDEQAKIFGGNAVDVYRLNV